MNRMKRLFLTLLVLGFVSGSLSACSETPGGSDKTPDNGTTTTSGTTGDECSGTKACADGYVCSAKLDSSGNQTGKGVCTKTCATSATCPTDLPSCVKGKSLTGAPQQVCGFCEQTHVKCAADADACIKNSDSKGVCTATCQGEPECTGTDKCLPTPAAKVLDDAANGGSKTCQVDNTPASPQGTACGTAKACPADYVCSAKLDENGDATAEGVCTKACTASDTCPAGAPSCVKGKSLAGAEQTVCGFCEQTHVKCAADADACIKNSDSKGVCTATCQGDPDCNGADKCLPTPVAKILEAAANGGSDTCQVDNTPASPQGTACGAAKACPADYVCSAKLDENGDPTTEGVCTKACTASDTCPADAPSCVIGKTLGGVDQKVCGYCYRRNVGCASDTDMCVMDLPHSLARGVCIKPCQVDGDCAGGKKCSSVGYSLLGEPRDASARGGICRAENANTISRQCFKDGSEVCLEGLLCLVAPGSLGPKTANDGWCSIACKTPAFNSEECGKDMACAPLYSIRTGVSPNVKTNACIPDFMLLGDVPLLGDCGGIDKICESDACLAKDPDDHSKGGTCVESYCSDDSDCAADKGGPDCVEITEGKKLIDFPSDSLPVKVCTTK